MSPPTTDEVVARFNQALANQDAGPLADIFEALGYMKA